VGFWVSQLSIESGATGSWWRCGACWATGARRRGCLVFGRRASRQLDHSRRKGSLSHSIAASRLGLLRQEHPARGRFGVFDRVTAQGVIESHRRGYRKAQRSFALALFELWRREYGVTA